VSEGPGLPFDNVFAVARCGEYRVIIHKTPAHPLSRHEALLLAAWLVQQAEAVPTLENDPSFGEIRVQVESFS